MTVHNAIPRAVLTALCALSLVTGGCGWRQFYRTPPPPATLGTISDNIWQTQENNAEASKFVFYQHEFQLNSPRLNTGGEDHAKQLAERILMGQEFPVVIERSMTSPRQSTTYKYPVHPNPQLDMQRREIVARSLIALGVEDADDRVVVAPAFAEGFTAPEAQRAYQRGIFSGGLGGGGFGGGGGGGGFGGGIF